MKHEKTEVSPGLVPVYMRVGELDEHLVGHFDAKDLVDRVDRAQELNHRTAELLRAVADMIENEEAQ